MIIGFDHLAMSCTNLNTAVQNLKEKGYSEVFREDQLPNIETKKKILHSYKPDHGMSYLEHKNGFHLELTRYSNELHVPPASFDLNLESPEIIELKTNKLKGDKRILMDVFRFTSRDETESDPVLHFHSPFKKWCCQIRLIDIKGEKGIDFLDSVGFPCMAFISTNMKNTINKLADFGILPALEPYHLTVNLKPLLITFFRLPGGALIELIELNNKVK